MLIEFVLFVVTFVICIDVYTRLRLENSYLRNIPIVSKVPVFGCALLLSSFQPDNLHIKFAEYVRRYGRTFYGRIFGYLVVVTAEPSIVDKLLSSQQHIGKSLLYYMLSDWLGEGLLLAKGERWQKMRKIITPTFHFKILEQFVEVFDRNCDILVEKLRPFADGETVVNIYPPLGLVTLDIIAETAMGVKVNAQLNSHSDFVQAVKDVTNICATRFVRPHLTPTFLFRLLAPLAYGKEKKGIETMHCFTNGIIEDRRTQLEKNGKNIDLENEKNNVDEFGIKQRRMALLDVLLQSTMDGKPLTQQHIREEVNTFMFEGHDTTTSATAFCLYLLSRHPLCQQRLFEEIRTHFDNILRPITYADLQNLEYLNAVVKESLRLYPPVPAIGRFLKEEMQLDDKNRLPRNTNVFILLSSLLRDPNVFNDPSNFVPERYLKEGNSQSNAYSNIPFSAGPRNCIGQKFALYEMRTIVIKMVQHYELFPLGPPVEPSIKIVMRSKGGISLGLKIRSY